MFPFGIIIPHFAPEVRKKFPTGIFAAFGRLIRYKYSRTGTLLRLGPILRDCSPWLQPENDTLKGQLGFMKGEERNGRKAIEIMCQTATLSDQQRDKQLQGVALESVLEKRRLDQALNAKEFAVLAGISYSTARGWFRLPGFPSFRGVIFWQDFVEWRTKQNGVKARAAAPARGNEAANIRHLPARAARILLEA